MMPSPYTADISWIDAREMAKAAGIRATVIEQSLADYGELMQKGFGEEDTSALIRLKRG